MPVEIDLLAINRGIVTAPAGCGKTHLIADALIRHRCSKPILVLTHTNAGVAALRMRLDREGVPASRYRLYTIDGWAIRLVKTFPNRSGIDPTALLLHDRKRDYPHPPMIADELRRQADVFTDLMELKSKIGRDPSERPAPREPR